MKALHLTIIVILSLVGIFSTASATSGNLTSNFQPPYPNTANLTMYNPLTFPALQAVPPNLLKTLPPLEQSEHGVMAKNITCNKGLQLIFKAKDSSPACVHPDTVQKLIERGWGNMLTPTAWFRYTVLDSFESGSNAHQGVPWSNYIPANISETAYKPWFNGTTIREYFTNHGVTVLEVRYSSYLLAGPEGVGTPTQLQTDFYVLTLQNDTSQMNQFGFKMINVGPRQDLSLFGQILPLNN